MSMLFQRYFPLKPFVLPTPRFTERKPLLPIHGIMGMLKEVRRLLMNQTVSVPRGTRMGVFPSCGHGQACSQKHSSATRNTDGGFLIWLVSKTLGARVAPCQASSESHTLPGKISIWTGSV